MDSRRRLTAAAALAVALTLPACATLRPDRAPGVVELDGMVEYVAEPTASPLATAAEVVAVTEPLVPAAAVETAAPPPVAASTPATTGRRAITAANREARAASRSDSFVGGVQLFDYQPGRVYEVWTAPLRVTTLTLAPGERVTAKAAGDTVRWQIGETQSGSGAETRTHVLLKPLERGLETNLVLTTTERVYHLELRSGDAEAFNAAVAWRSAAPPPIPVARADDPPPVVLNARYRVEAPRDRPVWTPRSVFDDGRRTFIVFDPEMARDEAPALFLIAADGERRMVNYRQEGGLYVVDRLFDRAELRLDGRRPRVVRLTRLAGAAS